MQFAFRRILPRVPARPVFRSFAAKAEELYTDKQDKTGRPLSPHVDIYAFPPAAITSVAIRITGVALSGGLTAASLLALGGCDVASLASNLGAVSVLGPIAKFSVAFPITYHYIGALRHYYWDNNPEALQTDKVTQLSYYHGGSAVALSVLLSTVTLSAL